MRTPDRCFPFGRLTKAGARPCRSPTGNTRIADSHGRHSMNIELGNAVVAPALALVAGILILLAPGFLDYFVALYLIVVGIVGLFLCCNVSVSRRLDAAKP